MSDPYSPESQSLSVAGPGGEATPQFFLNADVRGPTQPNGKDSLTISEAASQIVRGEPGWSAALGQGYTVSYGFRSTAPATMPDDTTGFTRFNTAQINQAELALAGWSDVANIKFVRVGSGSTGEGAYTNDATILLGNYSSGSEGASAFGYYPGRTDPSASSGDVWINSSIGYNQNPLVGNYGGMVLVHELGHAIGLGHPSEYDAEAGVTLTYSGEADYYEDSRQYTVMSYFSESNTGANFGGAYSAAPLLDDIAAAQLEYGVNTTTRTGDTVYGFNATADRPWFQIGSATTKAVFAVWDAGGTDTLDFSGYGQNQAIDLRAGHFSSVGGLSGNVAVAAGVTIENAIGGAGGDTLTGNDAANALWGRSGNDSLVGGAGSDFLRGEEGDDQLVGGAAFDDMHGNQGNDILYGGDGGDWVVGGQGSDKLYGEADGDIVYGNLGDDFVYGDAGNDWVRGGQGDDNVFGGAGDDLVWGDRGSDTLSGGAGADTFGMFAGAGMERVTDFSYAEGDRVRIEGGAAFTTAQVGADTVVDLGNGDQMVLVGVNLSSLPSGWILT